MSIEKSNYLVGNRTLDLPAFSLVPQPTTLPFLHYSAYVRIFSCTFSFLCTSSISSSSKWETTFEAIQNSGKHYYPLRIWWFRSGGIKSSLLWDIRSYRNLENQPTFRIWPPYPSLNSKLSKKPLWSRQRQKAYASTLMMRATYSSETSIYFQQAKRRCMPEDRTVRYYPQLRLCLLHCSCKCACLPELWIRDEI
jgi:hypothetical protein